MFCKCVVQNMCKKLFLIFVFLSLLGIYKFVRVEKNLQQIMLPSIAATTKPTTSTTKATSNMIPRSSRKNIGANNNPVVVNNNNNNASNSSSKIYVNASESNEDQFTPIHQQNFDYDRANSLLRTLIGKYKGVLTPAPGPGKFFENEYGTKIAKRNVAAAFCSNFCSHFHFFF